MSDAESARALVDGALVGLLTLAEDDRKLLDCVAEEKYRREIEDAV